MTNEHPQTSETAGPPAVDANVEANSAHQARRRPLLIVLGVFLFLATLGLLYHLYARQFERTDNAQIDGNISNISPRVAGTVSVVLVVENQAVEKGQLLAELDASDLEVAVAQAKAQMAQAEAQLQVEDPSVPITESSSRAAIESTGSDVESTRAAVAAAKREVDQLTAQLAQARANNRNAQLTKQRAEQLLASGALAQAEYDARLAAARSAAANVEAVKQAILGAGHRMGEQEARLVAAEAKAKEAEVNGPRQLESRRASVLYRQAALELAKAQLRQALLNLSYAKIISPVSGIIGKRSVNVGDRIAPGQTIFALAQISELWVTANFRETQLEHMQPGNTATIHVDALGVDLPGHVESLGGATGSRLSVLPPENATGNYVKVVQRLPVRITLDKGQAALSRLRPGMSVEPKVRVR